MITFLAALAVIWLAAQLPCPPSERNPALQTAVTTYEPFLSKSKQAQFAKAWLLTTTPTSVKVRQCYHHYVNFGTDAVNMSGGIIRVKQDGKKNFKRNVDRLLAFAQGT